jgi:undecaprenyl-diphosphatase
MDASLLHALNGFFFRHDAVEDPVTAYVNAAQILFLALLAILFVLVRGHERQAARRGAIAAGLSAALALLSGNVISGIVNRPRPFVAHPHAVHLFSHHAADAGFPSDHATASFAIAVAILLRSRRWGLLALAMAVVVSAGRVAMGIHYPTDVLAGAALGTLAALTLWAPPIRARLHALADWTGRVWDGALAGVLGRVGLASRG